MTLPLLLDQRQDRQVTPQLSDGATGFVNYLRFVSMTCRVKPKATLFEACAALHVSQSRSLEEYAQAMMRCMGEALGRHPRVLAPGSTEMTFDEKWLAQLGEASSREDEASLRFLLTSRVPQEHRRLFQFLVMKVSEAFVFS